MNLKSGPDVWAAETPDRNLEQGGKHRRLFQVLATESEKYIFSSHGKRVLWDVLQLAACETGNGWGSGRVSVSTSVCPSELQEQRRIHYRSTQSGGEVVEHELYVQTDTPRLKNILRESPFCPGIWPIHRLYMLHRRAQYDVGHHIWYLNGRARGIRLLL